MPGKMSVLNYQSLNCLRLRWFNMKEYFEQINSEKKKKKKNSRQQNRQAILPLMPTGFVYQIEHFFQQRIHYCSKSRRFHFFCTHLCAVTRDFRQCGMCDHPRLRPACAYTQSDQSLCWFLEYSMTVKLLTEHHLESLSLKGGCTGSCTCQNDK